MYQARRFRMFAAAFSSAIWNFFFSADQIQQQVSMMVQETLGIISGAVWFKTFILEIK